MLTQKSLTLTLFLAATFFVPGSNGQTLGESSEGMGSMALPFALTASKALITPPKPIIEVSSTEKVYISEGHALALADTQCLHTETPQVQLCFGNRWPTQIRLLPHKHLKIGLHTLGLSQLKYTHQPSFVTEPVFPGQDALPERNPVARAIVTNILQGVERPREIIAKAKQRSLMLLHLNHNTSNHESHNTLFEEPLGKSDATEEDSASIEWWGIEQEEQTPDADDSNEIQIRLNNDLRFKPNTSYYFASDPVRQPLERALAVKTTTRRTEPRRYHLALITSEFPGFWGHMQAKNASRLLSGEGKNSLLHLGLASIVRI